MENQPKDISSQAKLSAIVGMMFFAPLVKNNIQNDSSLLPEEKEFVSWYIQVGYANLTLLIITLLAALINAFQSHIILDWIIMFGSFSIFVITVLSLFACSNNINMRKSDEKIVTDIQHKWQLLQAYIPGLNFILWYRQEKYDMPYWRLKESILLWTVFIFGTLLLKTYFGIWILIVIVIRIGLLMINIDIIPLSIKKAINSIFSCNPWEIFAYIFAPIVSKIRKADYLAVLQARKQWYAQWQSFGIWILLQYIIFIAILYFMYHDIVLSWIQIVLLFAVILWIFRMVIFYKYKKNLLKIPILSEITSLVFH